MEKRNKKHRILGRIIKILDKKAKGNRTAKQDMNRFEMDEELQIPMYFIGVGNEYEVAHLCSELEGDGLLDTNFNHISLDSSKAEAIRQAYHGKVYREKSEFWSTSGIIATIIATIAAIFAVVLQIKSNKDQEKIELLQDKVESLQNERDFTEKKNKQLQNLLKMKG